MIKILTANSVPAEVLNELREWFISEWGDVDPLERDYAKIAVPRPIVAIDEQASLIGGLAFASAAKPSSAEIGIWINMVLVSPSHRRRGIASQLVTSAATEAKHLGICELFVLSEFSSLYQKLGWQVIGMDGPVNETILTKTL